jgi:hypothetical protein
MWPAGNLLIPCEIQNAYSEGKKWLLATNECCIAQLADMTELIQRIGIDNDGAWQ